MILYLTFNDPPSGIFSSQVIDVVKFIRNQMNQEIKLVSFISVRSFYKNRKQIKEELSNAIVLPMFPGLKHWRRNAWLTMLISFVFQPKVIIGRSVLATQLALRCKKMNRKIVYDGRGAIAAEWKEYGVVKEHKMSSEIARLEQEVILNSDFRIAVSKQLVNYWQKEYNYKGDKHIVIPCTLNAVFEEIEIDLDLIRSIRQKLGIEMHDTVFVYSGSVAGWQSFGLLYSFLVPILKLDAHMKLLFLSDEDAHISTLKKEFPGQVINIKLKPTEVPAYLMAADFGLLIRESSITNKVASPVKFAEYLGCGLSVIISEELGDYSAFVRDYSVGYVFNDIKGVMPKPTNKKRVRDIGLKNFTKVNYIESYIKLLKVN